MVVDVFIPFVPFVSHYTQTEFKQTWLRACTRVLYASLLWSNELKCILKPVAKSMLSDIETKPNRTESMEIENWKGKCCHLYESENFSQISAQSTLISTAAMTISSLTMELRWIFGG